MDTRSVQETYAPANICFGCGPINEQGLRIRSFQEEGRVSAEIHPYAAAAALASMLERLAAYHKELEYFGVTREDLVESCARMLVQTLSGRTPPASG